MFQRAITQSAPLRIGEHREAVTTAMRSAVQAYSPDEPMKAKTAAAAAAARYGLIGALPFGKIMGSDPLPPQSQSAKRLADAARRIELLVGYTRNDAAPFPAMNPRIARAKRFGPPGRILEHTAAAAMTRLAFSALARRLAKTWQGYGGRSATFRVDWSPSRLGACHCIELPLLFEFCIQNANPVIGSAEHAGQPDPTWSTNETTPVGQHMRHCASPLRSWA